MSREGKEKGMSETRTIPIELLHEAIRFAEAMQLIQATMSIKDPAWAIVMEINAAKHWHDLQAHLVDLETVKKATEEYERGESRTL